MEKENNSSESKLEFSEKELELAILIKQRDDLIRVFTKKLNTKFFIIMYVIVLGISFLLPYLDAQDRYSNQNINIKVTDSLTKIRILKNENGSFYLGAQQFKTKDDTVKLLKKFTQTEQSIKAYFLKEKESELNRNLKIFPLLCTVLILILAILSHYLSKVGLNAVKRKIKIKLLEIGAQELKDSIEKDFFTKLVEINFKYLDQYYLQTQEQADKSFWISAIAGIIGFCVMILGVILMFINPTNFQPAYVTTASGVITEFIAAVFFYLYNKTILEMSKYHQKLVITQNISLALKTADALKDSKEQVLEKIILSLIADVNKTFQTAKTGKS